MTSSYEVMLTVKSCIFDDDTGVLRNSVFDRYADSLPGASRHLNSVVHVTRGVAGTPTIKSVDLTSLVIPRLIILSSDDGGFSVEWTPDQTRAASGGIQILNTIQNGDELTVNGLLYGFYTGTTPPPSFPFATHIPVALGGSPTETATNLAIAITDDTRAGTTLDVEASALDSIVTVVCTTPGTLGNTIEMSFPGTQTGIVLFNSTVMANPVLLDGGTAVVPGEYPGITPPGRMHVIQFPSNLSTTTQYINLYNPNLFEIDISVFAAG